MKTTRLLTPLALVAAIALTGCSDDPAEFGDGGSEGTSVEGAEGGDGGAGGAEVSDIDPADVIASYEVEGVPNGAPDGSTVTVGVHSLTVEGDLMLLELYYTPTISGGDPNEEWDLYSMADNNPIQPILLDVPNLTQYEPIRSSENQSLSWSTAVVGGGAVSGETILWWGYFAAPPEGVESVDIQVYQDHPRIFDVEIQR